MTSVEQTPQIGTSPLVLIANDQEWAARAVESILVADGFRVLRAHTAKETLDIAGAVDPDLVILDHQLPDYSGVEVCRRLRADPRFGHGLPVIITTAGPSGRPQRLAAYEAGAWEFYGQPLDAEALLYKLRAFTASYREIRQLRESALLDMVTGLYTRHGLARRATELISEARRIGRAVSCVRWQLASPLSAEQLARIAAAIRVHGRTADAHGRLSAGEFAAVAPGTGTDGAEQLAERMRGVLGRAAEMTMDAVRTTVIAINDPATLPSDGEQLLERLPPALAA